MFFTSLSLFSLFIVIKADVRRFMDAGLLDLSLAWKEQDNRRLAKVFDAVRCLFLASLRVLQHRQIEDAHPDLQRFRAQWATIFLVHATFGGQKTYKSCKGKDGTYRARKRKSRRTDTSDLRAALHRTGSE